MYMAQMLTWLYVHSFDREMIRNKNGIYMCIILLVLYICVATVN